MKSVNQKKSVINTKFCKQPKCWKIKLFFCNYIRPNTSVNGYFFIKLRECESGQTSKMSSLNDPAEYFRQSNIFVSKLYE